MNKLQTALLLRSVAYGFMCNGLPGRYGSWTWSRVKAFLESQSFDGDWQVASSFEWWKIDFLYRVEECSRGWRNEWWEVASHARWFRALKKAFKSILTSSVRTLKSLRYLSSHNLDSSLNYEIFNCGILSIKIALWNFQLRWLKKY